jgi:phosphate acetyltransferase
MGNPMKIITPTIFQDQLFSTARSAAKRIVLPEGNEPRILQAANICNTLKIAIPVLLGDPLTIQRICNENNIALAEEIEIIDPAQYREKYIDALWELRRSKGLTKEGAVDQLASNNVLGTMMLQLGEVDGLVSGAVHTTADTIRPALQIIKTDVHSKLVSSAFFMCLPEQVLVYADCAINPNPNAEELAIIARQSAHTAQAFGIAPIVAMLSYSTNTSGVGPDVERVKTAVAIAKQMQPNLTIDGPLQYDAAIDPAVAALKAPRSDVAGRATVFIFPDLNAGNITYKAVQRSSNTISMGPILQGLAKPVNDLSRGCSIKDIVATITITAVQAIR